MSERVLKALSTVEVENCFIFMFVLILVRRQIDGIFVSLINLFTIKINVERVVQCFKQRQI